ncbi:MAG: hypothetical protein Q7V57_17340 [Actinomycetota bacterium]|nr:hypothetical protein [Actinomycetota bacterium]
MSSHTRALDATANLSGELTVDIIFLMRRKPWHWVAVAGGFVFGLALGYAAGTLIGGYALFLALSCAGVLAGLGMNVGSDFEFVALTPSRLLLVQSSRVIAHPTRVTRELDPAAVRWTTWGPLLRLDLGDHRCLTSSGNGTRLQRMLSRA